MILSVAMLLKWVGVHREQADYLRGSKAIDDALDAVLADAASRTPDLGGALGTQAFGDKVAQAL